ncbi:MAG: aminotransferase class V-fold PLP-dependent enzyme [Chthoniobacterales bacterium]|nr:aminotransferase class V-fold PLP-dependent enzyme [Chthoniobacterales bacterium]
MSRHADSKLDPSAEEIRRWGDAAVGWMAEYLHCVRELRVYPETTSRDIRERLDEELPTESLPFLKVLDTFREVVVPATRQNAHPRMFGYVQAPGTAIAALADLLASTLNANLTAWRSTPAAVEIERLTIDWVKQIIGFNADAAGLFVSGGSMANFAGLAAARRAKAPDELMRKGAQAFPRALRIYASEETHHSVAKAAAMLGIGSDNVRYVAVDERFRIRIDDLEAKINEDVAAGHLPICIVGNAGTVNTGACDSLEQVSETARRFGLWMHVDGSYGGFATLAPSARACLAGIERADSISLDPHKWLYLPVDCGCVLYRDPETARATFAHEAEYTRVIAQQADEAFAVWDYGPELSRRFRALKVWMLLTSVGVRAVGESIEKDLACARHLESLVRASDDFEMLAPVELSIFCFRYVPAGLKGGPEEQLDAFNERLLVALQRDGSSYLSNARIHGRFALRGCVMNYRTTHRDMEILLMDLRRLAATL